MFLECPVLTHNLSFCSVNKLSQIQDILHIPASKLFQPAFANNCFSHVSVNSHVWTWSTSSSWTSWTKPCMSRSKPQVPTSARLVPAVDPSGQKPFSTSGVSCSCQAISDAVFILNIMLISFFPNGYVRVSAYFSHRLLVPRKYRVILAITPTQKYPKTSAEQRESG